MKKKKKKRCRSLGKFHNITQTISCGILTSSRFPVRAASLETDESLASVLPPRRRTDTEMKRALAEIEGFDI